MISFNKDTVLNIITGIFNGNIISEREEICLGGLTYNAEIISSDDYKGDKYVDLKFADGGLAKGVLRECFKVL